MIFQEIQTIDEGFFRDITLLFVWISIIMIYYLAYQIGRRIKEGKIISATTGLTIYVFTLGFFLLFTSLPYLYDEISVSFSYIIAAIVYLGGMIVFIVFFEMDNSINNPFHEKRKINYLLSLISITFAAILLPLIFIDVEFIPLIFIAVVPCFIIASVIFMRTFQSLEIVKHAKPLPWFFTGIMLSGLSNFLYSYIFVNFLGFLIVVIRAICVLLGCMMTTRAWNKIPNFSELDWMMKMEQLLVIHIKSSSLLYQYDFKTVNDDIQHDGVLKSSAMGGIEILLKEILASKGNIKEIDHEEKKIIFKHGVATACILIVTAPSEEFTYRLEMFHLSFEKYFGVESLKNWDCELSQFEKTSDLINQYFLL